MGGEGPGEDARVFFFHIYETLDCEVRIPVLIKHEWVLEQLIGWDMHRKRAQQHKGRASGG